MLQDSVPPSLLWTGDTSHHLLETHLSAEEVSFPPPPQSVGGKLPNEDLWSSERGKAHRWGKLGAG